MNCLSSASTSFSWFICSSLLSLIDGILGSARLSVPLVKSEVRKKQTSCRNPSSLCDGEKESLEIVHYFQVVIILFFFPHRLPKIKEWIDANDPGSVLIPFSGILESKLADMPEDEKERYLKENGITR